VRSPDDKDHIFSDEFVDSISRQKLPHVSLP
jgi:hypothetical protein